MMRRFLTTRDGDGRDWLWRILMGLHTALLLWWPLSVIGAAFSVGALTPWQTGYLYYTSLAYPLFIAAAYFLHGRLRQRGKAARTLALCIPFLSGTWITAAILIPALLIL